MKEDISRLEKYKQEITNAKAADSVVDKLSLLADISIIGAPFGSVIRTIMPSRRLERLETFIQELAAELEKIRNKIDVEYLTTDEFIYLFEQCIKSALDNYQEEKQQAYKAILINSLLPDNKDQALKEFYLNLINQLTTTHFALLSFCRDTFGYLENKGINSNSVSGNIESSFKTIFSEYDFSSIRMAVDDLNRLGLIELDSRSFQVMTSNQGMDLIGSKKTTTAGDHFIEFITL